MPNYVLDFGPSASGIPTFTVWRDLDDEIDIAAQAPTLGTLTSGFIVFEYSGIPVVQFRAVLGDQYVPGVIDTRDRYPFGEGSVRVDHDFGGADNLQIREIDTDEPVDGAFIYVYLKEDYDLGRLAKDTYLQAWTITRQDGRWQNPVYLDPGSYTLLVVKQGARPVTREITVTKI